MRKLDAASEIILYFATPHGSRATVVVPPPRVVTHGDIVVEHVARDVVVERVFDVVEYVDARQ